MAKPKTEPAVKLDVLAELRKGTAPHPRDGRCTAARKLDEVPADLKPTVAAAVEDRENISTPTLAAWLKQECRVVIAYTTFASHRAGRCSCDQR